MDDAERYLLKGTRLVVDWIEQIREKTHRVLHHVQHKKHEIWVIRTIDSTIFRFLRFRTGEQDREHWEVSLKLDVSCIQKTNAGFLHTSIRLFSTKKQRSPHRMRTRKSGSSSANLHPTEM